jgi:hypothetical protein
MRLLTPAATKWSMTQNAESIKHHGLIQPVTVRPNSEGFELIAGARRYRAAQLAELFSIPARIVEIDDTQALERQLVELSIVGKSFLCLYATSARRLYVIDVPGLPQLLDTTECRRPVRWNAVADCRFGTFVIRRRMKSNAAMGTAVLLSSNFRIGDDTSTIPHCAPRLDRYGRNRSRM